MKVIVVMLDRLRTELAIKYEGQAIPYRRRLVEIELTPDQVEALTPRRVGKRCGEVVYEERGDVWIKEGDE